MKQERLARLKAILSGQLTIGQKAMEMGKKEEEVSSPQNTTKKKLDAPPIIAIAQLPSPPLRELKKKKRRATVDVKRAADASAVRQPRNSWGDVVTVQRLVSLADQQVC